MFLRRPFRVFPCGHAKAARGRREIWLGQAEMAIGVNAGKNALMHFLGAGSMARGAQEGGLRYGRR